MVPVGATHPLTSPQASPTLRAHQTETPMPESELELDSVSLSNSAKPESGGEMVVRMFQPGLPQMDRGGKTNVQIATLRAISAITDDRIILIPKGNTYPTEPYLKSLEKTFVDTYGKDVLAHHKNLFRERQFLTHLKKRLIIRQVNVAKCKQNDPHAITAELATFQKRFHEMTVRHFPPGFKNPLAIEAYGWKLADKHDIVDFITDMEVFKTQHPIAEKDPNHTRFEEIMSGLYTALGVIRARSVSLRVDSQKMSLSQDATQQGNLDILEAENTFEQRHDRASFLALRNIAATYTRVGMAEQDGVQLGKGAYFRYICGEPLKRLMNNLHSSDALSEEEAAQQAQQELFAMLQRDTESKKPDPTLVVADSSSEPVHHQTAQSAPAAQTDDDIPEPPEPELTADEEEFDRRITAKYERFADPQTFEADTAVFVKELLSYIGQFHRLKLPFEDVFRKDGSQLTEKDVPLEGALIECTLYHRNKYRQTYRAATNLSVNAEKDPVVVFAPFLTKREEHRVLSINRLPNAATVYVVRDFDQLQKLLLDILDQDFAEAFLAAQKGVQIKHGPIQFSD